MFVTTKGVDPGDIGFCIPACSSRWEARGIWDGKNFVCDGNDSVLTNCSPTLKLWEGRVRLLLESTWAVNREMHTLHLPMTCGGVATEGNTVPVWRQVGGGGWGTKKVDHLRLPCRKIGDPVSCLSI